MVTVTRQYLLGEEIQLRFTQTLVHGNVLQPFLPGVQPLCSPRFSSLCARPDSPYCRYLELNIAKTKEMIIDFRKKQCCEPVKTIIHSQEVEIVTKYKYLGTIFDDKLSFDINTDEIVKKCRRRLYFLRKLNSFSVNKTILTLFYKSYIESVLCFSFICWYHNLGVKNKTNLQKIIRICSKITGEPQRAISQFCDQQTLRKAHMIVADKNHALNELFELLPSGKRYRTPMCKTNRRRSSFIPSAIKLLNTRSRAEN